MAALVIRDALAVVASHEQRTLRAEDDLLERIEEILRTHLVLIPPGGEQRRLVDEVSQVRSSESRGCRGDLVEPHVGRKRHVPSVNLEDGLASILVGQVDDDVPVEPPGSQQCLVEHVGLVRCGQHDDALPAGEAVHLGENLVERLFLLAPAASCLFRVRR
jgi:hypothetical protein